jgi:hypothetical protein
VQDRTNAQKRMTRSIPIVAAASPLQNPVTRNLKQ